MAVEGSQAAMWDGHLVFVHASERQRRDAVAAWIRRGLDVGAKIVYIEPADVDRERSLRTVLHENHIEATSAMDRGQLRVLPADETTPSARWQVEVLEEALADGYATMRWSIEARTGWSVLSASAQEVLEWATDELCDLRPVSVLCQYPASLPEVTLQTVCAMHQHGLREAGLAVYPSATGAALAGEVDAANERVLRCFLKAATVSKGRDPFVVDMSGLDFLDVRGARALLTGSTAHRLTGRSLCLRAPQSKVAVLLGMLGVECVEGITVETAP